MEVQDKTNQKFESVLKQEVEENKEIKSQITKLTNALIVQEFEISIIVSVQSKRE